LFLKDASKPEGEACNPDGTLKDADKMEWLNSPSDVGLAPLEKQCEHAVHVLEVDDEPDDERVIKRH
jgi:hypothetical protein